MLIIKYAEKLEVYKFGDTRLATYKLPHLFSSMDNVARVDVQLLQLAVGQLPLLLASVRKWMPRAAIYSSVTRDPEIAKRGGR